MRKPAITGLGRPSGVDDTWSNPESAKKMMKKYAGNSSDLKMFVMLWAKRVSIMFLTSCIIWLSPMKPLELLAKETLIRVKKEKKLNEEKNNACCKKD